VSKAKQKKQKEHPMSHRTIRTVEELSAAAGPTGREFVIALEGGALSRKFIKLLPSRSGSTTPRFYVLNMIDDSDQTLSADQLSSESNIGAAMAAGAFSVEEHS
jgi:hypothetical protein